MFDPATKAPTPARKHELRRRIRILTAATISYNVVEAIIALAEGTRASSTALIGFGLDSVIEVASAAAVAWQFSARDPETREKTALRFVAVSFFALAAYVAVGAIISLYRRQEPHESAIGIGLATASLIIMPLLATAQRRAGREFDSRSAVADSNQTLLCTYLSAVLLLGLGLHSLFGWWWSDPVAALGISVVACREGITTWRGQRCCPSPEAPHRC